jgi:polynucleotide 5'-hydroxyl-kinase GRC3/NOL9
VLSASALKKRLLERQAPSPASNASSPGSAVSPEGNGKAIDDGDKASPEKPRPRDKVSDAFERLLLEGADIPAGGDGYEDFAAIFTSKQDSRILTTSNSLQTPEPTEEPPKRKVVQLSSFKPTKTNFHVKGNGVAVLKFPDGEVWYSQRQHVLTSSMLTARQRLVILGSYGIRVKSGEAAIAGATLFPSETIYWVHAPHCHALPVLRCAEKSVIELHAHQGAPGLRNLENLSPLFGSLWNEVNQREKATKQTYQLLSSSEDGPKKALLQDLKSPAEWNKKIYDLTKGHPQEAPVFLVCGPKSSGKSTFSRLLANRLMTSRDSNKDTIWPGASILDIDPGQPEFSPPGVISHVQLKDPNLAPPFGHPILDAESMIRSHALASITPASDTEHYWECVMDLYRSHQSSPQHRPLLINTPGWVQGTGLGLLMDLISKIHPTEVIYMSEDGPDDTVDGLKSVCADIPFTSLPSQSSDFTSRTALHLRHMQAMSYFHVDPESSSGSAIQWDATPLASKPPILLQYSGRTPGILGVLCYGYQPGSELLADSINGTLVAIVEIEDRRAFCNTTQAEEGLGEEPGEPAVGPARNLDSFIRRTPEDIPYIRCGTTLRPRFSRCIGLALVRGFDTQHCLFALVSPVTLRELAGKEVVLVSGKFDVPTWAYTQDHYNRVSKRCDGQDHDRGFSSEPDQGTGEIPWVESLHGGQKRTIGSKAWRVRRDLGRSGGAGD